MQLIVIILIILSLFVFATATFSPIEMKVLKSPILDDSFKSSVEQTDLLDYKTDIIEKNIDSLYQNLFILNENIINANKNVISVSDSMWKIFLYESLQNAGLLLALIILGVVIYYKIKIPFIKTEMMGNLHSVSKTDIVMTESCYASMYEFDRPTRYLETHRTDPRQPVSTSTVTPHRVIETPRTDPRQPVSTSTESIVGACSAYLSYHLSKVTFIESSASKGKYFRLNLHDIVEFQLKEGGIARGMYTGFRYKPNYSSLPFFEKKEAISIFPEKKSSTYEDDITIVLDDGLVTFHLNELDWQKIDQTKIN